MKKTGAALFILAATVAWFLWPQHAAGGRGDLVPATVAASVR